MRGGDVGKVGKIGIEGKVERIQIKTIVHLEGRDGRPQATLKDKVDENFQISTIFETKPN